MLESDFKREFKDRLKARLWPLTIFYIDTQPNNRSFPDTVVLCGDKWAALEFKKSSRAKARPNQPYYVELLDSMSFSRFVYPSNSEEVIGDLERLFTS